MDFKTYPPKHAKGEAGKSQSGPDAAAIKGVKDELCATPTGTPERVIQDYTGDLSNSKLRALCEAEYGGVTALHNEWSILKEFKDNALFDDIRELMEGAANVN
ncbi:hypothetical protein [Shewanella sp. SM74]|uniref:hypothetical protein n=1 Tax=Shewanella sp. SM74 TaxID=2912807 RepID=UPI0021DA912D|nr:hypothetical protein [Shewanella sp. SM74]